MFKLSTHKKLSQHVLKQCTELCSSATADITSIWKIIYVRKDTSIASLVYYSLVNCILLYSFCFAKLKITQKTF